MMIERLTFKKNISHVNQKHKQQTPNPCFNQATK